MHDGDNRQPQHLRGELEGSSMFSEGIPAAVGVMECC